eukprot:scaffold79370_cov18-Tisochrysis_lutea.AAC.3
MGGAFIRSCACLHLSQIAIPLRDQPDSSQTYTIRENPTAEAAAKEHDACAIGVYGLNAVPHLNFPPSTYGLFDIVRAMDRMCVEVRLMHGVDLNRCGANGKVVLTHLLICELRQVLIVALAKVE